MSLTESRRSSGSSSWLSLKSRRFSSLSLLDFGAEMRERFESIEERDFIDIEEIGMGHASIVYKSLHVPSGRVVSRKVMGIANRLSYGVDNIDDSDFSKLSKEIEALRLNSNCEYVVQFYGAYIDRNCMQISIVMEYMDLGSLKDIIVRNGPIKNEAVLSYIASCVLKALDFIDSNSLVHRDLKPSNILLSSSTKVKLSDFGECSRISQLNSPKISGSLEYMAPERIRGEHFSIKSDIWSLGITLIEIFSGKLDIFSHCEYAVIEIMEIILSEQSFKHIGSEFMNSFLERILEKDVDKRGSVDELLSHPFITQHLNYDSMGQVVHWFRSIARADG